MPSTKSLLIQVSVMIILSLQSVYSFDIGNGDFHLIDCFIGLISLIE